jgi:hypothetical protein
MRNPAMAGGRGDAPQQASCSAASVNADERSGALTFL